MDERIKALGELITACPARARCPGILQGRLVNDPGNGVPPRGLFMRPCTARLEHVEIVVLGLNPGRADEDVEKPRLREAAKKHGNRLFRYVHAETLIEMKRLSWKYWRRMDTVLRGLGYEPSVNVVLAAEIVFCECARPPAPHPGERKKRVPVPQAAIAFCSERYVNKLLPHLPQGTPLICVGGDARKWLSRSPWNDHFRWAWMHHISGAYGDPFGELVDANGALREAVRRTWQATLERQVHGKRLSRDE